MLVKGIQDETLQDYKKVGMLISACSCDWKCCREAGKDICQNSSLAKGESIFMENDAICKRYLKNPLNKAIIFGGLEPMLQFDDVLDIIATLRVKYKCDDDIVIYTGYTREELCDRIPLLQKYSNIIIKFGRFVPNAPSRFDEVLGITLVSDNQHAEKIS